jgi:hypothetical protein
MKSIPLRNWHWLAGARTLCWYASLVLKCWEYCILDLIATMRTHWPSPDEEEQLLRYSQESEKQTGNWSSKQEVEGSPPAAS